MNMDTHKINGGQMTAVEPYTPKTRPSQRGTLKARTNASQTTKATRLAKDYWLIERLVCGEWVDVCELIQYSTGVYQIVGSKQKHRTLNDAMTESEGMDV